MRVYSYRAASREYEKEQGKEQEIEEIKSCWCWLTNQKNWGGNKQLYMVWMHAGFRGGFDHFKEDVKITKLRDLTVAIY